MKKLLSILLLSALSVTAFAQCNQYYVLKKGTAWEFSNFNSKGKLESKTMQKVTEYKETSGGFEATIEIVTEDDKGEQVMGGSTKLICENGVMLFDLKDVMSAETMEAYKNFDMSVDGINLEIPDNLKVDQELKDAEMNIHIEASPMQVNLKFTITDRKVLAEENLKVPAGSFDCFKITQKVSMKMMMMVESISTEWYAREVGMIKSESYNKKGKLMSYSLLTAYSK